MVRTLWSFRVQKGGETHFQRMQFFAYDPAPGAGFIVGIAVVTNDKYASTGMQLFLVPQNFSQSARLTACHRRPLHDSEHAECDLVIANIVALGTLHEFANIVGTLLEW